jgi:hypothetical protein
MRLALALSLLLPAASFAAPPKKAGGPADPPMAGKGPVAKTPGVCGAKVFPLVEGNEWTYGAVASMAPLADNDPRKRMAPAQPKTVVITVKSIAAPKGAGDTVVTLEEKITTEIGTPPPGKPAVVDERTLTTTITCNSKGKFEVSPESFFFAAEPGGTLGLKVDSLERKHDTSWKLTNGGIGDATWREELVAQWTRVPTAGSEAKLGSGKLELEHTFTPQQPELIITKIGQYRAEKVGLQTTGRVTLDGALQLTAAQELPAGWLSTIWLAEGVGFVQVLNAFSHEYQLVDAKLK